MTSTTKNERYQYLLSVFLVCLVCLPLQIAASKGKASQSAGASERTEFIFYNDKLFAYKLQRIPADSSTRILDLAGNTLWITNDMDIGNTLSVQLPEELGRMFDPISRHMFLDENRLALNRLNDLKQLLPDNPYISYLFGQNYLAIGQTDEAIKAFKQASSNFSQDLDSLVELGNIYFHTSQFKSAITEFKNGVTAVKQLLKKYDSDRSVPAHFKDLRQFKEFKATLTDRQNLLEQNLILAYSRRADQLYNTGNQKEALTVLESAMKLQPKHYGLLETYRLYTVFQPQNAPKKGSAPLDIDVWTQEVQRQIESGSKQQALKLLDYLRTTFPDDKKLAQLHDQLNVDQAKLYSDTDAITLLLKAVETYNSIPKTNTTLTKLLEKQIKDNKLISSRLERLVTRYLKAHPDNKSRSIHSTYFINAAKANIEANQLQQAKELLVKALEADPKNWDLAKMKSTVHVGLATQLRQQGQITQSIENYEAAIESGNASWMIRFRIWGLKIKQWLNENFNIILIIFAAVLLIALLVQRALTSVAQRRQLKKLRKDGWQAYKEKQWNEAIVQLERYIKSSRNNVPLPTFRALAESYTYSGDLESALNIYRKISYLYPGSETHLFEAKIFIIQRKPMLLKTCMEKSRDLDNDTRQLIDYCFELIEKGEDEKELQEIIGTLYFLVKDYERAKYIFTQVVSNYKHEDIRYSYKQLIDIAKITKQTDQLKKLLSLYEKHHPDDHAVHLELGYYNEAANNMEEAIRHYEKSLSLSYSEHLEQKLNEMKEKKAIERLQSLIEETNNGDNANANQLLALAELKLKTNAHDECLMFVEKLLETHVDCNVAIFRIGGIAHYMKGNYRQAADYFKKFLKTNSLDESHKKSKESRYLLANSYLRTNEIELAVHEFQTLHSLDPKYRDVSEKIFISVTSCPYCDKKISSDTVICPHCQSKVQDARKSYSDLVNGPKEYEFMDDSADLDVSKPSSDRVQDEPSEENNSES